MPPTAPESADSHSVVVCQRDPLPELLSQVTASRAGGLSQTFRQIMVMLLSMGQGASVKCFAREVKFMRSGFNWNKENIGLAIAGAGLIIAIVPVFFPNIRCLIPIVNRDCCKLLFQQSSKIEYKYSRGDDGTLMYSGLVDLDDDAKKLGIVRGKFPIPGFSDPVSFEINYKNDNKWTFDYYFDASQDDVKGKTLIGGGECISPEKATGVLKYQDGHDAFSVIFKRIEE